MNDKIQSSDDNFQVRFTIFIFFINIYIYIYKYKKLATWVGLRRPGKRLSQLGFGAEMKVDDHRQQWLD